MEFQQDIAGLAIFYSESRQIILDTHADDGCGTGPAGDVEIFKMEYIARVRRNYFTIPGITARTNTCAVIELGTRRELGSCRTSFIWTRRWRRWA